MYVQQRGRGSLDAAGDAEDEVAGFGLCAGSNPRQRLRAATARPTKIEVGCNTGESMADSWEDPAAVSHATSVTAAAP